LRIVPAAEKLFFGGGSQNGKEMKETCYPGRVRHPFSGEAAYPEHPEPGGVYEELLLEEVAGYHLEVIGRVYQLHQALLCLPHRYLDPYWSVQDWLITFGPGALFFW
jgi:hypothetical protein